MPSPPGPTTLTSPLRLTGPPPHLPLLVYGTAWKKTSTSALVARAVALGFRGIDTAAQPRHYREDLVGAGVRAALSASPGLSRADLFLQTKYTPPPGQDHSDMPYDPSLPVPDQVVASVESSLRNLATPGTDPYIDCLVLHSPFAATDETLAAWRAMATFVPSRVRRLGISNTDLSTVQLLLDHAAKDPTFPAPAVVQNRFYPGTGYEVELRALCRERGVAFQAFWTLSGDGGRIRRRAGNCVARLADACGVSREVAQYCLVLGLGGMTVLDGTTDEAHMAADLEGIETVGRWAAGEYGTHVWKECLKEFKGLVGEV